MNDAKKCPYLIGMPSGTDVNKVRFCLEVAKAYQSEISQKPMEIPGNGFRLPVALWESVRLNPNYAENFLHLCDEIFGSYLDYDIATIR